LYASPIRQLEIFAQCIVSGAKELAGKLWIDDVELVKTFN